MEYAGTKRTQDSFDAEPKRQKVEGASKVLHVRGLPSFCTEEELTGLVQPFGQVVKCLLLTDKQQAFVQMANVEQATQLLQQLEYSQPTIRSKNVYFQYSSRQEVEVRSRPQQGGGGGVGGQSFGALNESPTLIVTVSNVSVPVTLDNIVQICKPYGEVLKVITFTKGGDFQALVQMASNEQAAQAKMFLEGKDMFQGCCHLNVGFSKRHNLIVKQNDQKSRDFTLPQMGGVGGFPGLDPMAAMGMGAAGAGMMGGQQYGAPDAYGQMGGQMGGQPDFGAQGGFRQQQQQQPAYGGYGQQQQQQIGSPVVLVSELNAETDPEVMLQSLFTLFGVYGDVWRVKILYNKRNTAMIQFADAYQASLACANLNHSPLHGTTINVNPSKHFEVKLPRGGADGQQDSNLTKDFSDSPNHRYRGRQINPKNVNAPSRVLHVANVMEGSTEQQLRDAFGVHQATGPPVVEFFKTSRKMCYVGMESVEAGVNALMALHNTQFGNYPLRVSFSPKDIAQLTNSDAA